MSALTWLRDKVYWRMSPLGWCCYRKTNGGYMSLCARFTLKRLGGQQLTRPMVIKRCGRCDGLEMVRRGWEESGPESPPNKK